MIGLWPRIPRYGVSQHKWTVTFFLLNCVELHNANSFLRCYECFLVICFFVFATAAVMRNVGSVALWGIISAVLWYGQLMSCNMLQLLSCDMLQLLSYCILLLLTNAMLSQLLWQLWYVTAAIMWCTILRFLLGWWGNTSLRIFSALVVVDTLTNQCKEFFFFGLIMLADWCAARYIEMS
jgi:hypothetical protein